MQCSDIKRMYPLSTVLEIVGVKPGKFHRHFYGGAFANALAEAGELADHISDPMRGAGVGVGVGRGGGRYVTVEGAICLALFFRMVSGGVESRYAIKIAQTYSFLGEVGNGLRAFRRGLHRPAGSVFPVKDDTFLVVIADTPEPETGENLAIAFVPGSDLTPQNLMAWLTHQDAETQPVCVINLSKLCCDIRDGLHSTSALIPADCKPGQIQCPNLLDKQTDPLGAFLADCTSRDDKARISTQEFLHVFEGWNASWPGISKPYADGSRQSNAALKADLAALGIRKLKSNGIMSFAGIRWRESQALQQFRATRSDCL